MTRLQTITISLCHISLTIMAAAVLAAGGGLARGADGYSVEVKSIKIRDRDVATTDAAEIGGGESARPATVGSRLEAGSQVTILYPEVQMVLVDSMGSRFALECSRCTPEEPLRFVVGNPTSKTSYKQSRGNVSYEVESQGDGWFEIMMEVVTGPEEIVIPVAVKGTRFMLEPDRLEGVVTVAEGAVGVGEEAGAAEMTVSGGETLAGRPGAFDLRQAEVGRLRYLADVLSRTPTMRLAAGSGRPLDVGSAPLMATPIPEPGINWGPWALMGAGAASVVAGGVVHYLAYRAEGQAFDDAAALCGPIETARSGLSGEGEPGGPYSSDAEYNRLFDERVRDLEISAWALYGTGAALAAGGILWQLLDKRDDQTSHNTTWQLSPLPTGGAVFGATFGF
jgi:hypothetical protein